MPLIPESMVVSPSARLSICLACILQSTSPSRVCIRNTSTEMLREELLINGIWP